MIASGLENENLRYAAELLKKGEVVAFPTETVYGLGANAFNEDALKKIFKIKARPTSDPLILHLYSETQLRELVLEVSPTAQKLMNSFWPGPLTLIFKKSKKVSDLITAGLDTVAIRIPKNEIALELLKLTGLPVAAPSANKFQSMSPTTAQAVLEELGDQVGLIIDGGLCESGLESTVLSIIDEPEILRFGAIPAEDIEMVLGHPIKTANTRAQESARQMSPGLLSFHYAPRTRLVFCRTLEDAREHLTAENNVAIVFDNQQKKTLNSDQPVVVLSPLGDLKEAAQNLFIKLRQIDKQKPSLIIAIAVPTQGLGRAINDRLSKAQH